MTPQAMQAFMRGKLLSRTMFANAEGELLLTETRKDRDTGKVIKATYIGRLTPPK